VSEISKRERQKKRREARLAQERAAEAKARRNRLLVFALLGVIFAGLIGLAVANNRRQAAELAEQREAVKARLDDLGCTEPVTVEDRGQGHLTSQQLAESPPEVLYPDRPATSGEHFSNWFISGVYDELLDERVLVHDLEHGYVVTYYDEGLADEQVEELKTFAQEQIDGDFQKLIVAPWDGELPDDANVAYTGWNVRQGCGEFDREVMSVFLTDHHSGAGEAPEKELPAHTDPDSGIDPEGEPYLLPPLGTEAIPTEGMDEGGTVTDPEAEASEDEAGTATEAPS